MNMKKHAYFLAAALVVAPGLAYCAAEPEEAPIDPANIVVFPQLKAYEEQAASPYRLVRAWNHVKNVVYPKVELSTLIFSMQLDKTDKDRVKKELQDAVKSSFYEKDYIRNATMDKSRSLRMAAFASLLGIVGMGTYALYNGMSACTVNNGLAATATLGGIFGLTRFALPRINNIWNQRVIRAHQNAIKKSELLPEVDEYVFKAQMGAEYHAIIDAMKFKPVVAGQGIIARIRSLVSLVSLPTFKIPFRRATSVTTAAPVVAPDVAPVANS